MARSVSTPYDALTIEYAAFDTLDGDDYAWQDAIENLRYTAQALYPSLRDCDRWIGRENHAVLENAHGVITVSEYCGLVAIALVPTENSGLAARWCRQVSLAPLAACFGTRLLSRGVFSNGEQFFTPAEAPQTKGELGLGFTSKEGWL